MVLGLLEILSQPYVLKGLIGVVLASIISGIISLIIRYTQTQFLAIESLHMILAAASTGYLINLFYSYLIPDLIAYLIMIIFVFLIAFLDYRRIEQNTSIAVVAFISATISIFSSYELAILSPVGPSVIYNILFGSPFFLLDRDLMISGVVAFIIILVLIVFWARILLLAFDPEYFEFLKGSRKLFEYKILIYSIIAISSVYLTRLVGAIASHILLIAPSITPFVRGFPMKIILLVISLISIFSLLLSIVINIPYGASLGILAIIFYVIPNLVFRKSVL
ncbi:MAG: metal ABC transporter permease [Sulfolobales archaeon]